MNNRTRARCHACVPTCSACANRQSGAGQRMIARIDVKVVLLCGHGEVGQAQRDGVAWVLDRNRILVARRVKDEVPSDHGGIVAIGKPVNPTMKSRQSHARRWPPAQPALPRGAGCQMTNMGTMTLYCTRSIAGILHTATAVTAQPRRCRRPASMSATRAGSCPSQPPQTMRTDGGDERSVNEEVDGVCMLRSVAYWLPGVKVVC